MHSNHHQHSCNTGDHTHSTNAKSHSACISLVPIFNHLEDDQMDEIMLETRSREYKKGEIIYRAGDDSDSLYIVSQGKIRIYRISDSGKEQLIRLLYPGDFTGELALFSEAIHEAYAEAMEATHVCYITRNALQAFLLKYPSISLRILSEFSRRLEGSEKQSARFATEKVETRIALFLAESIEKEDPSMVITLPMSKKDIASYLGTTPETLSRKLTEFEEAGYIRQLTNKRIKILDLDALLFI